MGEGWMRWCLAVAVLGRGHERRGRAEASYGADGEGQGRTGGIQGAHPAGFCAIAQGRIWAFAKRIRMAYSDARQAGWRPTQSHGSRGSRRPLRPSSAAGAPPAASPAVRVSMPSTPPPAPATTRRRRAQQLMGAGSGRFRLAQPLSAPPATTRARAAHPWTPAGASIDRCRPISRDVCLAPASGTPHPVVRLARPRALPVSIAGSLLAEAVPCCPARAQPAPAQRRPRQRGSRASQRRALSRAARGIATFEPSGAPLPQLAGSFRRQTPLAITSQGFAATGFPPSLQVLTGGRAAAVPLRAPGPVRLAALNSRSPYNSSIS